MPWKLVADPSGYIFKWLVAYSALLGSIGGVLIADYFVIRRTVLDLPGLYTREGPYWFRGGWNPAAFVALTLGIAPNIPGFLGTVGAVRVAPGWLTLYHYAWFVSFGVSFVVYVALSRGAARSGRGASSSRTTARPQRRRTRSSTTPRPGSRPSTSSSSTRRTPAGRSLPATTRASGCGRSTATSPRSPR